MPSPTSPLVTREMFRAELHRAFWIFSVAIVAANAGTYVAIVAVVTALD